MKEFVNNISGEGSLYLGRVMGKLAFTYAKTKTQISFAVTAYM